MRRKVAIVYGTMLSDSVERRLAERHPLLTKMLIRRAIADLESAPEPQRVNPIRYAIETGEEFRGSPEHLEFGSIAIAILVNLISAIAIEVIKQIIDGWKDSEGA